VRARLTRFSHRLGLIAALGLVVRLVVLFGPARDTEGFGDWHFFHDGANLLAQGHWFVEPFVHLFTGRFVPSAGHPPLWELVLGGVSSLGGTSANAQRATGCVLGALAIVLIGLLARRVGGERAGIAAAAVAALYPVFIGADTSLLSETLYGVLVAGSLLVALRVRDGAGPRAAAGLGALVALAALTRSEALILVPLLALPVAMWSRPGRWTRAVAVVAACAVVLAPWAIRNWSEFGRPVLISTNDGTLLAGANCGRTYHGIDLGFWNIECISKKDPKLDEVHQEAVWRREGAHYASHHIGRLPVVLVARLARTFDVYQPRRMVMNAEGRLKRVDQAGVVAYFLLLPFGTWGGLLLWRRRRSDLLILLTPVAMVIVQTLTGYGIPRFRHAAEITLVVLAGVAIASRWSSGSLQPASAPMSTTATSETPGISQSQSSPV
jgi:4-amino-4-deoxy-L-arabinose transferase-like glycosyltransferase